MLGYVRTDSPQLKICTFDCYRGLYCGLCKSMGKCTGNCSRITLSYDFVFLAAVRMALLGEKPVFRKRFCLIHPFRRRNTAENSRTLSYCADASAILSFHKAKDDLADEKGLKKCRAQLIFPLLSGGYRKAGERNPKLDLTVREQLKRLNEYESSGAVGADEPSVIFGELMGAVFAEGLDAESAKIAYHIGYSIGRWIYLADAADDFPEDVRSGRFNPLAASFGEHPTKEDWEELSVSMKAVLSEAEPALDLLPNDTPQELNEIIRNIFYLGLPAKADRIIVERKQNP